MGYSFILKSAVSIIIILLFVVYANGQDSTLTINIDQSKMYQTINSFGASDAWSCQFVGNWPEDKKNNIADLLFSKDTLKDGSPKGIALSLWRFNIGAGTTEQAEQSDIKDEWHRTESFLSNDGTYNWQKQAGQMWFLNAAKARGVGEFLGFINSPPVNFTKNGKAYANAGKTNVSADHFGDFANYISVIVKGVYAHNHIELNYISPVNEPQWKWSDTKQEGSPYSNKEIASLVRCIDSSFAKNHVKSKILVAEAGDVNYLVSNTNKTEKGNQINDFFRADSPDYIGNLKSVYKAVLSHSYFTTSPMASAIKLRQELAHDINSVPGLSFWQSEYCILGNNNGEIDGNKRDLGMDAALYLARVIHTDLAVGNAASWAWWLAISPYDYKDGLIYVDKNKTDGNYYPSKMLWAMGNYSRFIRPGAVRIETSSSISKPLETLPLVSAYKKGKNITIVIVNNNNSNVPVKIGLGHGKITHVRKFTTSSSADLHAEAVADASDKILIQARSITTLTGIIQ
ncbi:O-glycosyl hydrolase [Mucilaginibacter frigoritolerans]|uniref:O-glycosyl hydrolase n=1 Tax=Mucilaginibacter frigoritolerans TaxID=652788 RepID=A0A562UHH5_9SPHI|nr:glycoside hydrolase [Mucilaginibacter frigoritolerans]TWJ04541.1 O-glycosyl hydrolase [Mucilaginibacter frigoritolerans]